MKRIIISAMAPNRAIGHLGRLPWHLPDEYAHFLSSIKGNTMVMGRRSWEVFGADAQTVANIVISSREYVAEATEVAKSLEDALEKAETFGLDIFIAGGGQVYQKAVNEGLFDEIWLSTIHLEVEGDTFFPELDLQRVECLEREERGSYLFERWNRRSVSLQ